MKDRTVAEHLSESQFDFLHSLNPQQRLAVVHGESPLLIVAGAGTGKTTTLAHRVAWQVISGIDPSRILLLTFSRRAASEMLRRVESILQNLDPERLAHPRLTQRATIRQIKGGTFHSVATGLLRKHGQLIGLYPDFTILDRSDSEDLMNLARAKLNLPAAPKGKQNSKKRFPLKGTCLDIYSRCVNTQIKLDAALLKWFPWCLPHKELLGQLFTLYAEYKEQQRVLDFDDLLLFWNALSQSPAGQSVLRQQFDRVLVDEYQDTNVLQADILKNISPGGMGMTAVGDDAQSIYSFRAATIRNILDFPQVFSGTEVIPLEQNYRSAQSILNLTNSVIAEAQERHRKELWSDRGNGVKPILATCGDEDSQTDFVVDTILEQREKGVPLQDQAVLFRSSHHAMSLEAELVRRKIPFRKFGGLRFLETAHIKDMMSFLRLAENPFDAVAGFRLLVLLPGIGQTKAGILLDELRDAGGQFDAWAKWKPPASLLDLWPEFVRLLLILAKRSQQSEDSLAADLHAVRTFYTPLLEAKFDNVKSRTKDLQQLEVMASRYRSRGEFLTEMTLDPPSSTQDLAMASAQDEDSLVLSTIHSAKGLEWDTVFVIHAADGNIPADQATGTPEDVEEERRLFYVALTRAKNSLFISRPERYFFQHRRRGGGGGSFSQITRFLPAKVQDLCEKSTYGNVSGDFLQQGMTEPFDSDTSEIRQKINNLWS